MQIAEQEHQFREILEFCPAGLNVVDNDGRVLFHNAFSGSLSEPAARQARLRRLRQSARLGG